MAGKVAASGGGKKKGLDPNSEPNVIPFIDIMLVLLIIFMVTAPIPTVDIRVDLPPPNPMPMPPREGRRPTIVVLDARGQIFVGARPATLDTLGDVLLDEAIRNNPVLPVTEIYAEAQIFVRADQSNTYGSVVNVMSRISQASFVRVGIFAETAQSS